MDKFPAGYVFTEADRVRAQQVLQNALDELFDSNGPDGMFAANADLLRTVLTDERFTAMIAEWEKL